MIIYRAIKALKDRKLKIEPGFDGEYGKISIFSEKEKKEIEPQKTLF